MNLFLQVFCSLFSALLCALAIPNEFLTFGSPFLGLIALIPHYLAVSKSASFKNAVFLNALQVMAVHLISSFWLANFRDFAIFTLGASAAGTACIGAFFGWILFFPYAKPRTAEKCAPCAKKWGIFAKMRRPYVKTCAAENVLSRRGIKKISYPSFRVLYFSAVWVTWEWVKSNGFLGYPWGTLSMCFYNAKCFIQIADISGAYGITFLALLFSSVCAEGLNLIGSIKNFQNPKEILSDYKMTAALCVSFFVLSFAYGVFQYSKKRIPVKFLNTVIVQQNIDPWGDTDDSLSVMMSKNLSEQYIEQMRENRISPDLVVWSEAVLRRPFPQGQNYYKKAPAGEPLINFIDRMNVPFLVGAPYLLDKKTNSYGNAAVLIDADGIFRGAYSKIHLVPFAEIIPWIEFKWMAFLMDSLVGFSSSWKAGNQYVLFDIPAHVNPEYEAPVAVVSLTEELKAPSVKIGTPICFEDAFPKICGNFSKAGCELFVNLTDDSWSRTASAEYQHFVIAALRSVEFRTPMVRSTNSGYSTVIDPAGRVLQDLPLFTHTAASCAVPVYEKETTIYERFGNWLAYCCMIFVFLSLCFAAKDGTENNGTAH
ncbi:apolipoprotein N-acyltransferase [Treponema parvum]|uniref:Apolipoprotein N-acyltransferase n=1 Tax=Treponema parvum TaxID=138851 RepID=A0A975EZ88_9SPIR|nr:apolipoprotein N-acyltransferase [Treponema parvum]QTQ11666.1 apolipoprotein N-acyltransferase [Treponema parvum]